LADTIFALSSGAPPAAIGVIRVSGPEARTALVNLAGRVGTPRRAELRTLRNADGAILDRALVSWFPAPASATGEDIVEFHCHGGRAVVAAIERTLAAISGLRRAQPGEFTRRVFENGRLDLAEAEGLADLLAAETELQRLAAMERARGSLSRQVDAWRTTVLQLSAEVEGLLNFSDEDDAASLPHGFYDRLETFRRELEEWFARPRAERLREGFRIVLAGPPNSGKSTLFNAMLGQDAAIVSPVAGTTRDVIERPIGVEGVPFVLIDAAGTRPEAPEAVEAEGILRATREYERADVLLWLGPEGNGPPGCLEIETRSDEPSRHRKSAPDVAVSGLTGDGVTFLWRLIQDRVSGALPKPGGVMLNERQAGLIAEVLTLLGEVQELTADDVITAEILREVRRKFDRVVGRSSTEDMLDDLFGRFCIGK
jgi:tRNA modification GTPase